MEEVSTLDDRQDKLTQPISTHKQTLRLTEEGSILKSVLVGKRKKNESTHASFRPRSNLKPKNTRGMFRTIMFKIYLLLSLPISISTG